MRQIVIASHDRLAEGMYKTLKFLVGNQKNIHTFSAYLDNEPIEAKIHQLMKNFNKKDQIIIFTDLLAGSVNQKFAEYRKNENVCIIAGMNLPLIMGIVMTLENEWLTYEKIKSIISEAREQMQLVNTIDTELDEDDE